MVFPFLEEAQPQPDLSNGTWAILIIIFLILCLGPWIFVIFRYGIFRKLRIRFILPNNEELEPKYFKKNEKIILPEAKEYPGFEFKGWFIDPEMENEYIDMPMPNKNIKLYAKYQKIENE